VAVLLSPPSFSVPPDSRAAQLQRPQLLTSPRTRLPPLSWQTEGAAKAKPGVFGPSSAAGGKEEDQAGTRTVAAATAMAAIALRASGTESAKGSGLFETVKLPLFVGLWYFFNIQYNLVNKQVLNIFPAVWATAWWQLAAGVPIAGVMWLTGLLQVPKLTKEELKTLLPIGGAHAAGQILTVASLGAVAVSFAHTVKALEPGVNAIASGLLLGQVFHPFVYASLIPVFAGVAMASAGEMSFTMFGFLTAFAPYSESYY